MKRATRKRLRTAILGVFACSALFWGAVDLVGVPVANLVDALGQVTLGTLLVIALAALPAAVIQWRRRRRQSR